MRGLARPWRTCFLERLSDGVREEESASSPPSASSSVKWGNPLPSWAAVMENEIRYRACLNKSIRPDRH